MSHWLRDDLNDRECCSECDFMKHVIRYVRGEGRNEGRRGRGQAAPLKALSVSICSDLLNCLPSSFRWSLSS